MGPFDVWTLLKYFIKLPWILKRLSNIVSRYKVQVVNLHFPGLAGLSFVLLKRMGLFDGILVLSFHGLDVSGLASRDPIARVLWRILLAGSDIIVACSDNLAAKIVHLAPSTQPKVRTIQNGIDPVTIASELEGTASFDCSGPYILNVGKFEHKKGQDVLIKAFGIIAEEFPKLRLVLVGADGPALEEIRLLVQQQSDAISERVKIIVDANHSTVMQYMSNAVIFILPSREEPFGIVLLEAGISETAVIASRVGGIPEVIEDGVTGLMIDPDDPDVLAATIRHVLSNDDLRDTLASRHMQRVLERFSWKNSAEEYADSISRL